MPSDLGLVGQGVRLEVIPLREALFPAVVSPPPGLVNTDGGGGQHVTVVVLGAEPAPAQGRDVRHQVLHESGSAVLAAVAFVHHREHRDHVAHRGDVGVPDPGAGAGLGRAGGDVGDVFQWQDGGRDRVRGAGQEASAVQVTLQIGIRASSGSSPRDSPMLSFSQPAGTGRPRSSGVNVRPRRRDRAMVR
ncbi:hypothetical protein SHKM778_94870 (plasmid) [Streptomyces sp. KM77-8]|uniref:Uncharacterized protein n=1 Tax=Streptomyces haneummycinicus TaxID=3074435 RepID=A0AAT9I0L1_9ACTN